MRCGLRGSGVRLAHDPQSSIDRLCLRLRLPRNEKSPRTGGDAAPIPTLRSPAVGTDQRGSLSRRRTARMAQGYRRPRARRDALSGDTQGRRGPSAGSARLNPDRIPTGSRLNPSRGLLRVTATKGHHNDHIVF
ncbi:hypothetical protein CP969_13955 [Streptomyces viridosporus T7A]|uniref:Uncharacterized protein n=1 Tax=Streptomyces viridosporus T7A TaxID=665577 RepID=A0ABX6ADY2_STRVD|nr:hypothetical protein CP969_13955 [Streptomyces viridosporus T7A]